LASQILALPSALDVTTSDPFGLKAAEYTEAPPGSANSCNCRPVAAFQIRALPSALDVTTSDPFGLKTAVIIADLAGSVMTASCLPVVALQIRGNHSAVPDQFDHLWCASEVA
jgi:hypothetical protein